MLLRAITGEQNFPNGSSKLHIFFIPTRQHMGKEEHIGKMARGVNPDVPCSVSGSNRFMAYSGGSDRLGTWTQGNYDVPEGVVLKLFGMRRGNIQGQSLGMSTANIYIQLRSGAALQRIRFNLIESPRSPIQQATIEGRFDVLDAAQLGQMGVGISPQIFNGMRPDAVRSLFTVDVMDRALNARQEVKASTIKNAEGQKVTIQKAKVNRAVRLDI